MISRYISQPRQKPKTALSRAATSANPVATSAEHGGAGEEADQADEREARPTACAKRGGRGVLELGRAAPRRGRTSVRNSQAYGVCWTPSTGADREQRPPGPRAARRRRDGREQQHGASTTAVSAAANCGPRGSIRTPAPTRAGGWSVWTCRLLRRGCRAGGRARHGRAVGRRANSPEFSPLSQSTKGGWRERVRQDIRHSAERTRQWSTARRLVSMVEDMTRKRRRGRSPPRRYSSSHSVRRHSTSWTSRRRRAERGEHLVAASGARSRG